MRLWLLGLPLALLVGTARADSVLLKDGREVEGTVVSETAETVKLRVSRGTGTAVVELARTEIRLVIKKGVDPKKLARDAEEALALGHRDDAIRILASLVAARPDDARARRDLAFAELLDEQLEKARDDYARSVALDASDVESLVGLGYASARTGDRDAAIEAYRKATVVAPRHTRPWLALGELLLARSGRGDRDEAIVVARHALEASPQSADAALLAAESRARAQGLGAEDEHKAALDVLEKFLSEHASAAGITRVARRAADLAFGLGDAARAKRDLAAAIQAAPEATAEERERILALEALYGWFADGRPAPALGVDPTAERLDLDAALRRTDHALEAVPAEGDLLLLRARLLARKGRRADALEAAASAEAALPMGARGDATLLREWLDERRDPKLVLAPQSARRLAELLPFATDAQEMLGRSLERAGDVAAARDAMKRASELAPEKDKKRLADEADRLDALAKKQEKNKDL